MAKIKWSSEEEIEKDRIRVEEEKVKEEKEKEHNKLKAKAKEGILEKLARDYLLNSEVSEEEKELFTALYDLWEVKTNYKVGGKVQFEGSVYEVIQEHISQADWSPEKVPALFKVMYQTTDSGAGEVIPNFVQPIGAHDAYSIGDKVLFEEKVYESSIDNNTWSPSGYPQGWNIV